MNPSVTYDGSSCGGRPLKIPSYSYALESLGQTINFVNYLLHCFEDNFGERPGLYKARMKSIF